METEHKKNSQLKRGRKPVEVKLDYSINFKPYVVVNKTVDYYIKLLLTEKELPVMRRDIAKCNILRAMISFFFKENHMIPSPEVSEEELNDCLTCDMDMIKSLQLVLKKEASLGPENRKKRAEEIDTSLRTKEIHNYLSSTIKKLSELERKLLSSNDVSIIEKLQEADMLRRDIQKIHLRIKNNAYDEELKEEGIDFKADYIQFGKLKKQIDSLVKELKTLCKAEDNNLYGQNRLLKMKSE